jgi:hypothetical protein
MLIIPILCQILLRILEVRIVFSFINLLVKFIAIINVKIVTLLLYMINVRLVLFILYKLITHANCHQQLHFWFFLLPLSILSNRLRLSNFILSLITLNCTNITLQITQELYNKYLLNLISSKTINGFFYLSILMIGCSYLIKLSLTHNLRT